MGNAHYTIHRMGREVEAGYGVSDVCNWTPCKEEIDRGLSYLCGATPGGDEYGCGHYFCEKHLSTPLQDGTPDLCPRCRSRWDRRQAEHVRELIVEPISRLPGVKAVAPYSDVTSILVDMADGGQFEITVKP